MHTYTATIGRNQSQTLVVNGEERTCDPVPMSDERWSQFEADVASDLITVAYAYQQGIGEIEIHRGEGYWQGVREESSKIEIRLNEPLPADHLDRLRRLLSENARLYGQDAIALTIGESELC